MRRPSHPLWIGVRPDFELGTTAIRSADLFCGCGGLTLGLAIATAQRGLALEVALALDTSAATSEVFARNFPKARVELGDTTTYFSEPPGAPLSARERDVVRSVGTVDVLVGGPPCQGNSNLNNHTRRSDPKNALYARMARAAEILEARAVLIENVPSVVHDRAGVTAATREALLARGLRVADAVVSLLDFGVAQRRRRHVMLALDPALGIDPGTILADGPDRQPLRDLRWAIGDLRVDHDRPFDRPSKATPENEARMAWLHAHDEYDLPNALRPRCHQDEHSYKSMYGRLRWDEPAQTITSGFGSMGQGRYVHPQEPRTLTPHEAARLQGFPDYFSFEGVRGRGALATMIANAVPPQLAAGILGPVLDELARESRNVGMQP